VKHLKPTSNAKRVPMRADAKIELIMDPCPGLTGKQLKKCEYKAYKGGVVY
jgi:hypothetical protein